MSKSKKETNPLSQKEVLLTAGASIMEGNPGSRLTRNVFEQVTGLPRNRVEKEFGSFGHFVVEVEKFIKKSKRAGKQPDTPLGQKKAIKEAEGEALYPLIGEVAYDEVLKVRHATAEEIIEDVRKIAKNNPRTYITATAYRRLGGEYKDVEWINRFGSWQEVRSQAGLDLSRGAKATQRAIAQHSYRDLLRGFQETQIDPFIGKYEKKHDGKDLVSVLVFSDVHDKFADPFVVKVLLDTAERVQPDIICIAGDLYENNAFSRFDVDPRQVNVKESFDYLRNELLGPLRRNCPQAQIDFIPGNHDYHLLRLLAEGANSYLKAFLECRGISFASLLGLDEFQINLVSKSDLSAYQPKEKREELRRNYAVYFDTLVVGHEPRDYPGLCSVAGHTHKPKFENKIHDVTGNYFNLTLGSVAMPDLDYLYGRNTYSQSFAIIHIDPKLKEAIPEHIVFSNNYTVVGGVFYKREDLDIPSRRKI